MKRNAPSIMRRFLSLLGGALGLLVFPALITWIFLPASFHRAAWVVLGLVLAVTLIAVGLIIGKRVSGRYSKESMAPDQVGALVSLFKSLENRKRGKGEAKVEHLADQTEEAYQKEQAEWLASVKRKKEGKKRIPKTET